MTDALPLDEAPETKLTTSNLYDLLGDVGNIVGHLQRLGGYGGGGFGRVQEMLERQEKTLREAMESVAKARAGLAELNTKP